MFNLLRMDLYRVRRSKSAYNCFGLLLAMSVLTFWLMWLMATPEGQKTAIRIGMLALTEMKEAEKVLEGVDILTFFRQIGLDGGMYSVLLGIWMMLFVCSDYQSGFIKNMMVLHQNRWGYIGSKLITAGIVNFLYLILHFLFVLLLNALFGTLVPYAALGDVIFYLSWSWLLTTAYCALILFVCVLTRSVAAGALAAVLLGGGALVMPLYGLLNLFHAAGWLNYSIYLSLSTGSNQYTSVRDLWVYAVGAGFLVLYTGLSGIVVKNRDV